MAKLSRRERIAAAREKLGRGERTDAEALAKERRAESEKAQKREQKQVLKGLEAEVAELEDRQAFLDEIASAPTPPAYKVRKGKGEGKRLPAATYVMLASDWHMGERVRPEHVNFRNEHTPEIAQARAHQFWNSQLQMLKSARAAWEINQGLLWLGGDLMTGYIHEEYMEENFLSPVEEALLVHSTLVSGIDYLLDESDLKHVLVVTNHGNHGRTGKKMSVISSAKNSFEWLLYQFLKKWYEDEDRLTFNVASSYHNYADLYGFKIRFHHGEKIGYQGGIGGITIPANRRIQRQMATLPIRFELTDQGASHLDVFGHRHELMYPRLFIQNGSSIGWNDFADQMGCSYQEPTQCSFVVDERHKLVSNYNPIIVERKTKKS
jgi:hypothetical protein